jgi:hypothetical protein
MKIKRNNKALLAAVTRKIYCSDDVVAFSVRQTNKQATMMTVRQPVEAQNSN